MLTSQAKEALSSLTTALAGSPELGEPLRERWRGASPWLPAAVKSAADTLGAELGALTVADGGIFGGPLGDWVAEDPVLMAWCEASAWRRDVALAPVLTAAKAAGADVTAIARARVVQGPLRDALMCAPLLGDGTALAAPENVEARARLEILVWEAGASAQSVPELAPWLWGSHATFDAMIGAPARGTLRGRVLAARCLEVTVDGLPPDADQELVGGTLQVLQPLLLHPEPLVWVHAARALGRLSGPLEQLLGTLLDWVQGESRILRQRAITAFSSLPKERLGFMASQLSAIIRSPEEDAWALAAVAAATPYLFFERRDLWDRLAARILAGDGGAIAARALARGLATLFRRGTEHAQIEAPLRALREMARRARVTTLDDGRRWIEITAVTDVLDAAERDPLDLELGIENLVRVAAQYDDAEADARAARFADSLGPTFAEARRIVLGKGSVRHRAAATNALEGSARTFALALWAPLLATRPGDEPVDEPNLSETWKTIARAPAEMLDLVKERRQEEGNDEDVSLSLEVLAIRLGGYVLDACGEDAELGPGRGPTAHETCLWLRKIEGLADGSRELPSSLAGALSSLFWRLVDTTRGTALGEVDDVRWLGPFAAWWALVIDRPAMLLSLATALPMIEKGALAQCCEGAETLRTTVSSGLADGTWGSAASEALAALHADDTELAHALAGLARALDAFAQASGRKPELDAMCLDLVLAADRLHGALADPVKALHAATTTLDEDSLARRQTENAPRVGTLVARAIRARELSMLDVWFASLGPIASALLEAAVRGAIRRTPPPPPQQKKPAPEAFEGYELVKQLGEGGIGKVWLVRKPGADRLFVLKVPKADALANATDIEREGILASFVEEAKALAGLYHPNVANIIDRGVSNGAPFMVLEYLIGADLSQYAAAHAMSLFELRQVVLESCAGLAALHGAGLVHRDIKPANLWLRLPLAGGERFDPVKHRNPAHAPPLATVVIDFGMVRAIRVAADAGGRFVAGTPGYIAPEQVLDPVELDPRADVYAMAATVYNVTSGRAFFDDLSTARDRIIAHMRQDPFEDPERLRAYPAAMAKLLRAATAREPKDRPWPLEFGRAFAAALLGPAPGPLGTARQASATIGYDRGMRRPNAFLTTSASVAIALTLSVACGGADEEGDGIIVTTAGSGSSSAGGAGGGASGGATTGGTGGTSTAGAAGAGNAGTGGASTGGAGTAGSGGAGSGGAGAAGAGGTAGKGGTAGTGGAAGKGGAAGTGGAGGAGTGGAGGQMTGCLGDLQNLGVGFTLTKAKGVVDAVHITTPINGVLFANGTATKVTGDPMACEFVKTLWAFADVAKAHGFVRIGTLGSYCYRCCCAWSQTNYCRGPDDPEPDCGSNGYSNHSWGRAVDVRYLYKADGTMYDVNDNADFAKFTSTDTCGKGIQAQTGVSKELYTLVCDTGAKKVFSVILTPNYNDAHRNHFHMDIGQSGPASGFTVKSSHPDVDFDDGSPDACGTGAGP